PSWRVVAVANLRLGAAMGILTLMAGWVLASAPFVEATPTLAWHRWTGVTASIATIGAALASTQPRIRSPRSEILYRSALVAAAALVAIAGHLGATLVWGAGFLRP